jgi:multidrug resistance efflux pump
LLPVTAAHLPSLLRAPAELGSLAQAQAQMGAGAPGAGGLQANVQTFASNVEQQAQLWACFQSAYPNYSALTQQGAGAGTMG